MKGLFSTLLYIIVTSSCFLGSVSASAQTHQILSDEVASLQVWAGDDWQHLPVIKLSQQVPLQVGFDILSHEYRRCRYQIDHLEADWSESDGLFPTDYLDGFTDHLFIESDAQSLNTATLYTHYDLTIPNEDVALKLSGNYRLSIYDDNASSGDDVPLLQVYFMVTEESAGVALSVTTNTDVDINNAHQQVAMKLNYNGLQVTDPDRQIHTVVLQNGRWSTARHDAKPQFKTPSSMEWQHCRDYIFDAGNEFRKFEYLDLHRNSLGVDHTGFDGERYHVWLNADEPRKNYVYDVSGNGSFVIRNTDNYNNDTESEYFVCHFTYLAPEPLPGELYVGGWWTQDYLLPQYELRWDEEASTYHVAVPLKMGYYSYEYLLRQPDGSVVTMPLDGNYFQTSNTYQAFVYYREPGGRTDRLVGYAHVQAHPSN